MTASSNTKSASPCSCGGAASSCSCGCGSGVCKDQGFKRPHFFAGQLLTEEDLQSLADYVVAKNRLHNRELFGDGVVCGLEVNCHPCGGGKVIVQPGYALDCCGDDIVVPCPQTLDINAMIRDLRLRSGFDCGDPCADKSKDDCKDDTTSDTSSSTDPKDPKSVAKPKDPPREYCLYVNYCEQPTDPVNPYSTGETCGVTSCEASRVQEGFRFELRCREKAHPPADLLSRLCKCMDDVPGLERAAKALTLLGAHGRDAVLAIERISRNTPTAFSAAQVTELENSVQAVSTAANATKQTEESVRTAIDSTRTAASIISRFLSTPKEELGKIIEPKGQVVERVLTSALALRTDAPKLALKILPTALEQEYARAHIEVINGWTTPTPNIDPKTRLLSPEVRYLNEGVVYTRGFAAGSAAELAALREWLLDRLDENVLRTDCRLRLDVMKVALTPDNQAEGLPTLTKAHQQLGNAFLRYHSACACTALNPPCPPCEDTGLLLACLEVDECDVVKICNLDRKFVLTWLSMRYWLPLADIGDEFEELCCDGGKNMMKSATTGEIATIPPRTPTITITTILRSLFFSSFLKRGCGPTVNRKMLDTSFSALREYATIRGQHGLYDFIDTSGAGISRIITPVFRDTAAADPPRPAEETPSVPDRVVESLKNEMKKLAAKNAELEKRLKALEG